RGGVDKFVEIEEGNISMRKAKSSRANLTSLQSNEGPGPLLKKNRYRVRTMAGKEKEEAVNIEPNYHTHHTRYSIIQVRKRDPKAVERSWRWYQTRRSTKQGWTRKPVVDQLLDWYSDKQVALEEELDAFYEEQLESAEPLRFPNQKETVRCLNTNYSNDQIGESINVCPETVIASKKTRSSHGASVHEGQGALQQGYFQDFSILKFSNFRKN
ncbi:hypothetical protein PMAYCL1PPCAC_33187, partial [Pristionchus mayeri]